MGYAKSIFVSMIFCFMLVLFSSCRGQNQPAAEKSEPETFAIDIGDTASKIGQNIDYIFQDKNNNYWLCSNGEGVYYYNGKTIRHITNQHGLCSNFVFKIQEDVNGKLWFETRDGICNFDGKTFTGYNDIFNYLPQGKLTYTKGGLFFGHKDGMCFYDGKSFTNFVIHPPSYKAPENNMYRPYGVYCTLTDKSGNIWFGTQEKGACVYDGKLYTFIDSLDLGGPAVRAIYQDTKGILWFGNNGGGLFCYDGKTLRNITKENKLNNETFLRERMPVDKPGSLARVFAINEDKDGNLWIGTADAGVWKYDGEKLTNYTTKDGLSGNRVTTIFKDKSGKLWFVSNADAVLQFDGTRFTPLVF